MNLIVAVTADWGIGYRGALAYSVKEDMQFFRKTTIGKTVIMGRRTLESFPGGKPLKNRENIVLSANPAYAPEGVIICRSIEEVLKKTADIPEEDVFVIGGAQVYSAFLPWCRYAFVTKMNIHCDADRFFPNLDALAEWDLVSDGEARTSGEISFRFTQYENRKVCIPKWSN